MMKKDQNSSTFPPPSKHEEIIQLIKNIRFNINRVFCLTKLWNYSDDNDYKIFLCQPPLQLLETLKIVLASISIDAATPTESLNILRYASGILWYLSRDNQCRLFLASKEIGLLPVIMSLLSAIHPMIYRRHETWSKNLNIMLGNVSLNGGTHDTLLSPELQYLPYLRQQFLDYPDNIDLYRCMTNVCREIQKLPLLQLIELKLHEMLLNKLIESGNQPSRWANRTHGISFWCLNFLIHFTSLEDGNHALAKLSCHLFFIDLLSNTIDGNEGLKAAIVIINLLGKDERNQFSTAASSSSSSSSSLLDSYPQFYHLLLELFSVTLYHREYETKGKTMSQALTRGFAFGNIRLKEIIFALRNLSISDSNKKMMMMIPEQQTTLLSLTLAAILLFINNSKELSIIHNGIEQYAGGGGKDYASLEYSLELLLQLSFYYEDNNELQHHWKKKVNGSNDLPVILQRILDLPADRSVPFECKQYASTLLERFKAPSVEALSNKLRQQISFNSKDTSGPQHIMLSYAWGENKSIVVSLGDRLREMGYDVWRDEDGSSLVPPMSGEIVETMSEAVEHSCMVIICVSPEYKESVNCRAEAKLARDRQLYFGLDIFYVMVDKNYHTKTTPQAVDGWLGLMVAREPWYPLWDEIQIDPTASVISALLGEKAKIKSTALSSISCTVTPHPSPPLAPAVPLLGIREKPDFVTAWSCLVPHKSLCPKTLVCFLEEIGVSSIEDFRTLEREHHEFLAFLLKLAPQRIFKTAMNIDVLKIE